MRIFARSAVAALVLALSFAAGSAMAVTTHSVSTGYRAQLPTQPVNCKNPAECSVKFN
ncbi:MAG TPA: hypothetical protein VGN46_11405 [Luteibacter sp.]|jgi:hypothetical protein|uniref:hypothetical protein n=1 Tax=Luteibacter sp. TaxID=1886636 RepID=UPI002F416044